MTIRKVNVGDAGPAPPAYASPPEPVPVVQRPLLEVIGATFGGITVVEKIRELCQPDGTMRLDMSQMVHYLAPDPLPKSNKSFTMLYRFRDDDTLFLVHATEKHAPIHISRDVNPATSRGVIEPLEATFKTNQYNDVEIVAVLYGRKRIQTPSVLTELARFFSATGFEHQSQIRAVNSFFREDTWPRTKKSWTVYFRFAGSERIHCVTGLENGALEVPWGRH